MKKRIMTVFFASLGLLSAADAQAFDYTVKKGDTLASIAERFYGRIQHEKLLVAANSLDAQGGSPIVAGMRLEVPALANHRVAKGDTWAKLAKELLGSAKRADVLAAANGTSPWLPPEDGAEIAVPYNLRVIVSGGETIVNIAYKFMGDKNKAWVLDHYNGFKGRRLRRGDVVLVPLSQLELSKSGQKALREANFFTCSEAAGVQRRQQRKVAAELPALIADIRSGRYVDAVARANRFLATGALTKPQRALVQRQLLDAYVALEATGLAAAACKEWRQNDPGAKLDPVVMSPKVLAACKRSAP